MDEPDIDPTDPLPVEPIELGTWQRILATTAGGGMIVAAGWSIIASGHDGAGTVALVVSGTVVGALGVAGRLPTRVWGKDMGIAFETIKRAAEVKAEKQAAENVVDVLPEETKTELKSLLDRLNVTESKFEERSKAGREAMKSVIDALNSDESFRRTIEEGIQTSVKSLGYPISSITWQRDLRERTWSLYSMSDRFAEIEIAPNKAIVIWAFRSRFVSIDDVFQRESYLIRGNPDKREHVIILSDSISRTRVDALNLRADSTSGTIVSYTTANFVEMGASSDILAKAVDWLDETPPLGART